MRVRIEILQFEILQLTVHSVITEKTTRGSEAKTTATKGDDGVVERSVSRG